VLKIEGRGRSAEYVKTVTECYHEAIAAIKENRYTPEKIAHWMQCLKSVYNRDFWDGYYLGRKMGEWSERYGSQATRVKQHIGKITNYFSKAGIAEICIETQELALHDNLLIIGPTTGVHEEEIRELRVNEQPVAKATKGDFCSLPVSTTVRRGDKVYKWITVEEEF
jgi:putative protease